MSVLTRCQRKCKSFLAPWIKQTVRLSPGIYIEILQTDLHTFPQRISFENLIKDQGIFSWVIILLILITYLLTVYEYC